MKFKDPQAVANRIRAATESLTSERDISLVQEYLQELRELARQQDAEDFEHTAAVLHPPSWRRSQTRYATN